MVKGFSADRIQETRQGYLKPENGKKLEGLSYGCTTKGKKERSINSDLIVGMLFSKG